MLGLSAAAAAGVLVPWSRRAGARTIPAPGGGWPEFVQPPVATAPKFRWWWPNGQIDPAEIAREVDEVADAGCSSGRSGPIGPICTALWGSSSGIRRKVQPGLERVHARLDL